jgi:hypothetical protein
MGFYQWRFRISLGAHGLMSPADAAVPPSGGVRAGEGQIDTLVPQRPQHSVAGPGLDRLAAAQRTAAPGQPPLNQCRATFLEHADADTPVA